MAKKKAAAGADADASGGLADLMQQLTEDPEYMKQMEETMAQFGGAMEQMMKMSPEELAAQMEEAMKLFTNEDVVENVLNNKDEVLKSLEATGMVTGDELEKYKSDPNYFEQKMRESFSQMGDLFNNPDYISKASELMQGFGEMMQNPESLSDLADMMGGDLQSDEKIEEFRLKLLSEDFGDLGPPDEIKKVLGDATEFKNMIKNGPFADLAKDEL